MATRSAAGVGAGRGREVVHGSVGFGAENEAEAGEIDPQHHNDETGERAVDLRDFRGVPHIEVEGTGDDAQAKHGEDCSGRELMLCPRTRRQEVIDQVDARSKHQQRHEPAEQGGESIELRGVVQLVQCERDQRLAGGPNAEPGHQQAGGKKCRDQRDEPSLEIIASAKRKSARERPSGS